MYKGHVQEVNGKYNHTISHDGVILMPIGGSVSWGHFGLEAYNAGLTILMHVLGNRKRAEGLAHRFKREVLLDLFYDRAWELDTAFIRAWAGSNQLSISAPLKLQKNG